MNERKNQFSFLLLILCLSALYSTEAYAQFTKEWNKTYNYENSTDFEEKLSIDSQENVVIAGNSRGSSGTNGVAVVKYDPSGAQLWASRYNVNSTFWDMKTDQDNNVLISSSSSVIKYNSGGEQQWIKGINFPAGAIVHITSLAVNGTNEIMLAGTTFISGEDSYLLAAKLNQDGDTIWVRRNTNYELIPVVKQPEVKTDKEGNLIIVSNINSEGLKIYACKYDPNGNLLWEYVSPAQTEMSMSSIDESGNLYITGYDFSAPYYRTLLIKLNKDGSFQWTRSYSEFPNRHSKGYNLTNDLNGNLITGYLSNGPYSELLLLKYSSSGNLDWRRLYNASSGTDNSGYDVVSDNRGNVYVTGLVPDRIRSQSNMIRREM